jgi:hypothetical protein
MGVQGLVGRGDDLRVAGQAQVVVGAQVDHLAAIGGAHQGALRRGQDALALVETVLAQGLQFLAQVGVEGVGGRAGIRHGGVLGW